MLEVLGRRREIAPEMAAREAPGEVDEPVEHEEPGEEEMPAPSHGQVAMAGQRHRPGEAAFVEVAVGIGAEAEHAGRVELVGRG